MELSIIFQVIIILFSVVIHEVSHGVAAEWLGDPTARLQGRLTLNPIPHIDPIGSILVPILTSLSGFTFGWAKPVPFNPYNLRNQKWGELWVALAGPLSNIFIALVFSAVLRFGVNSVPESFTLMAAYVVIINLVLSIFNLVPIPPLDGSKVLFSILPYRYTNIRYSLERYGFILVLVFVFFLWQFLSPVIGSVFHLLTGLNF